MSRDHVPMGWLRRRAKASPEAPQPTQRSVGDPAEALEGMYRLIELASDHPQFDDADFVEGLVESGVDPDTANRLIVFVPLAFGRYVVEELGVRTDPTYERWLDDGTKRGPFALMDRVEFRVAMEHRDHLMSLSGAKNLAVRSAEVNVVNQMLHDGADPTGCVLTAVLVYWEGDD